MCGVRGRVPLRRVTQAGSLEPTHPLWLFPARPGQERPLELELHTKGSGWLCSPLMCGLRVGALIGLR